MSGSNTRVIAAIDIQAALGSPIVLGGPLTTSGPYALTLTLTGLTNVTLPTSGHLVATGNGTIAHTDISDWATATAGFGAGTSGVTSVAGRTGVVTLVHTDITDWAAATAGFGGAGGVTSVAGLTGVVTAAQLWAELISGLPTSLPATAGVVWLNGQVICVS